MIARYSLILAAALACPVAAQQSSDFPSSESYIVQLGSSQYASGLGEYLVPPLIDAFDKTGMTYEGGPAAQFAASVETGSDVGRWYGTSDGRHWLYKRFVTVGLSPANIDIEPMGVMTPSFSVKTVLVTPNEDRVDELECLISLATQELAARYRPEGQVTVDGTGCARK